MTAKTASTTDIPGADPMFGAPVDSAFETTPDDAGMMAGSDMFRRMQARPKSSATGYLVGGVAAVALIAGGLYFATDHHRTGAAQTSQLAAASAIRSDQQAQASKPQAQTAELSTQQSAQVKADTAQADDVAATGNPPAAAVDTRPTSTRMVSRPHEAALHRDMGNRKAASTSAAAAGVDASAITPPPAPVTATPAAPAPSDMAPTQTPTPVAPAPQTATPAPTPDQPPAQPAPAPQ